MRFLYNAPALLYRGALILGDTHFGIEERLRKNGINTSGISEQICNAIEELIDQTKAKKLILLGDVKENITTLDSTTRKVLARLKRKADVIIVRGNHDGGIEKSDVKVIDAGGFVYQRLGLVHGHSWPTQECMNADYLVSAHQHPQIELIDREGKKHSEAVWLVLECDPKKMAAYYEKFNKKIELILIPAFNRFVGSSIKSSSEKRLGPLLNNNLFKYNEAIVYRLDGSCLGKLKTIQGRYDG